MSLPDEIRHEFDEEQELFNLKLNLIFSNHTGPTEVKSLNLQLL